MKPLTEREISDLLTPQEMPEPPAGLADAIKREIPEEIVLASDTSELLDAAAPRAVPMPRSRVWLMAASVVLAVGGGFLAYRFMDRLPAATPESTMAEAPPVGERPVAESAADEVSELPRDVAPEAEGAAAADAGARERRLPARDRDDVATSEPPVRGNEAAEAPSAAGRLSEVTEGLATEVAPQAVEKKQEQLGQGRDERLGSLDGGSSAPAEEIPKPRPEAAMLDVVPPVTAAEPVLPPPPPPARPAAPAPRVTRELQGGSRSQSASPPPMGHENAQIGYENRHIKRMEAEARQLEEELRQLESNQYRVAPPAPGVAPPSTGGTAEPNDAPYGDVFFEGPGTNPFIDTEDDALSTFGLDVDTGSYTVARRYLRDGHLPPPASVRPEEYVNYFDYGDPAPAGGDDFAIHAEGAPSIFGEGERYHLLRFNLKGREIADEDRRPALLTFVVDVSGSMSRENRLGLVKRALSLLIDQLRRDDEIALVVYGSRGRVLLEPTGDHRAIRRAIERLQPEGSTNAEEGLTLAYELAARHKRRGAINRVILCSDGVANVGVTSAGSILERIRREADRGIELTTVGFGMGNYNDVLMERLADDGNGRYAYVDTLDEARRIFVENLTGTLQTLAAEARVQVEFDPEVVSRYRLVGYENRDIADHRFRDDTVDAGEIGAGHTVTALYEIKTYRELKPRDEVATLHLRYASVARGEMVEQSRTVTGADFARRWDDASPALKLTSLVAEYAEILKRSYWAREGDLDDVFRRAQKVSGELAGDREVADFVSLVAEAARLEERKRGE